MDFRKLENGAMQLILTKLNIPSFINEQIDSFSEILTKHGILLSYTNNYYGDNLWVDINLMSKVMFNLLSNAIKYSANNSRIHIVTEVDHDDVIISVKDSGIGISKENQQKIFEPFFQVENINRKDVSGSGIGLNLVQYVVKLHKGAVWVESSEGVGTTFFIRLHLGKEHFPTNVVFKEQETGQLLNIERNSISSIPLAESCLKTPENSNRLCILIVEDDEDMRQYISYILSDRYRTYEAKNGDDGLLKAKEYLPDLIISDIMMPVKDGLELCKEAKQNMLLAHIPIILLTAKVLEEHIIEGYKALADDYVLKPFNSKILLAKISSLIKNRNKLRRIFSEKLSEPQIAINDIAQEDPFMNNLIDLITLHAQDSDLSMETLYTNLGMSRTQFFRKIKMVSDLSPSKLILNIRMKMAIEKMEDKNKTIAEIAYEVGFSDPAYFSKVFKSVFSQTPTEYLKKSHK